MMPSAYSNEGDHVFIAGSARSGTTLLATLLFATGGYAIYRAETKLLDECPPRYGRLDNERAWRRFSNDWFRSRQFHRSGLQRPEFEAAVRDSRGSYAALLGSFMDAVASRQQRTAWIEDTPTNAFRLGEIARYFPSSKVIHVIRDGRAVAHSMTRLGWSGVRSRQSGKNLGYSALKWQQSVRAVLESRHHVDGRFHEVRYEDLVTRPGETLEKVLGFIGSKVSAGMVLQAASEASRAHSAIDAPNTAFGDLDSPISDKPAYRWKEQLHAEDRAMLDIYIGDTLRRCGYPVEAVGVPVSHRVMRGFRRAWLDVRRTAKYHTPLGRLTQTPLEVGEY